MISVLKKKKYQRLPDESLMQLIEKHADELAFTILYNRFSESLLNYFYRMFSQNKDKAHDFLHDLFLKIIIQPNKFDVQRNFKSWIYSVAHNMCKNEFRRVQLQNKNMTLLGNTFNEVETINVNIDKLGFNLELNKLLEQISTVQRSTFILRYQEDLSIKEIANIMDCSDGTVKSRLFYVVKKISKKLRQFDPEYIII